MRSGLALSWMLLASVAAPALAQSAGSGPPSRDGEIPDIIVTATRRAENLQTVPIAATAITGDQLNAKAVQRIGDLQFAAPSLSITDQGLTQSVNIRGIGIASGSPAVANGVATYIDGVFQPPILTTSSFYDIRSIEVLRGPQGTLVGSNSTGGAIFINTGSPTKQVEGYAEGSYGNYNNATLQGAVNLPISGTLAVRVAGSGRRRDSYFDDLGPFDNKPDRLNEKAGRIGLLWEPGSFRAIAKAELIDRNTGGYAYRPIETTTFANNRRASIRDLTYNTRTRNHERAFLGSLELRQELASGIVLRSVSGYTNKRINNLYDLDGAFAPGDANRDGVPDTPPNQTQDQFVRERQWSEEVNIISPTGGVFNWILGGYYQKNKIDVVIQNRNGVPVDPTDVLQLQNKRTLGVFAQTGYKITPALEVQLGARYSTFRAVGDGSVVIGRGGPIFGANGLQVANLAGRHKDGRLTGKLALNYTLGTNDLLYVFAARGYKPGGANSLTSQFGPETVWDYEAGWKSTFLDNHLRTQLGVFYMDYKDFQFDIREQGTGQTGVANLGGATIKGVEFQAQAKAGGFSLDGGFAYVGSKLDRVTIVNQRALPQIGQYGPQCAAGVASNPPICFNYNPFLVNAGGGPNLYSPKWSYNVGAQYDLALASDMTLTPRLNYAYVGSRWTNLLYSRQTDFLKGRGLLSAQLILRRGDWSIEAFGTNLANKKYVSGQSGFNEFYGAPREYGVRGSVRF